MADKPHVDKEQIYYVENNGKCCKGNTKCGICGRAHQTKQCHFCSMTKCTNCRRFGHNTKDCFAPGGPKFDPAKRGKGKKPWKPKTKKNDGAEVAQLAQDIDLEMTFVATNGDVHMFDLNDIEVPLYLWIANTSAMMHITHTQDVLTNYVSAKKEILGIETVPVLAEGCDNLKI